MKLSRDVPDFDRGGFEMLLTWFEKWRIDKGLSLERQAAKRFWLEAVKTKPRHRWQLKQWGEAIAWQLNWVAVCRQHGRIPTSLPERLRTAVVANGARRGLLPKTRKNYSSYVARFGAWDGDARATLDLSVGPAWLQQLVDVEKLSYQTQKVALNSLVFFYRDVCGMPPEKVILLVKLRKTNPRIPVVLSRGEVLQVLAEMQGRFEVYARLQYGTGMRISELMALRLKDFDWERNQLQIHGGKGDKDRITMLPGSIKTDLLDIRDAARPFYDLDRAEKLAGVKLSHGLARKYPSASES